MLLLHGLGSSGEDWLLQTAAIGERRRVVTPDLPGHGRTPGFRHWPRLPDYARPVRALVERLDLAPLHVVGLSLGGAVALQLAVEAPALPVSLVLVSSFARFRTTPRGALRGLLRVGLAAAGRMDAVGRWVAADLFPSPDQAALRATAAGRLAANRRGDYLRALWAVARFDVRSRLAEIRCPTLVIAGGADRTVPLEAQRRMARSIPGARLVVLPGAGHAAPVDNAPMFNDVVVGFLAEVDRLRG